MSGWDAYVQNLLAGNVCEFAALIGLDGNIWSSNFGVAVLPTYNTAVPDPNNTDVTTQKSYNEQANFVEALSKNGLVAHGAGFRLNNQKYYTVNFDQEAGTWFLKKDKGGACIALSKTCAVVGTFSVTQAMENGAPQNPSEVNKRVIDLAKYLVDIGY